MTTTFEDRLLAELRTVLPAPQRPARRSRWLLGGATAAVGAAIAAIALVPPAYAIHTEPDGNLTITMNSSDPEDIAAAETDLKARGVRIELVASTHDCLGVLGAPTVLPSHPPLSGPPSPELHPELYAFRTIGDGRFFVHPDVIPADDVLWVAFADDGHTLVTVAQFAPAGTQPDVCG